MDRLTIGGGLPTRLDGYAAEICHGASTRRPPSRRSLCVSPAFEFSALVIRFEKFFG
jgi:hypothetical protein